MKKKTRAPATHPKYIEMITTAITGLQERMGSSRQAILEYIVANNEVEAGEAATQVRLALKAGLVKGVLTGGYVPIKYDHDQEEDYFLSPWEKTKRDEYLLLLQEKKRLLEENPVASQRSKEEKAHLHKIYNRMGKISKSTDVVHLLKRKAAKSEREQEVDAEAREPSLEAIIAEKEVKAGRELNAKEREYLTLHLERRRILQIAASVRGRDDKKRYTAIHNRFRKLRHIEEFLKLPPKACKSGAERMRIYREKMCAIAKEDTSGEAAK